MIIIDKTKLVCTENFFLDKKQLITNSQIFMFDPIKFKTDADVIADIKKQLDLHPAYIEVI